MSNGYSRNDRSWRRDCTNDDESIMSRSGIEEPGIIPKLLHPGACFHETAQFELIETHISWVKQFPQDALLESQLERRTLYESDLAQAARTIADFHALEGAARPQRYGRPSEIFAPSMTRRIAEKPGL